jgi:hypothetical protein
LSSPNIVWQSLKVGHNGSFEKYKFFKINFKIIVEKKEKKKEKEHCANGV